MTDLLHSPAVLALELPPGALPERRVFSREETEHLAGLLAEDLCKLLPGAESTHLVLAGALFDQTQLLRPGWPVFAELAELAQRGLPAADPTPRVLAFGAHEGAMPTPVLQPEPALGSGAMLFLPWMFCGESSAVQALGQRMERDFVARGEAGARTSDALMRLTGLRLEHARYLTRHDVCALSCVQLEHAGLSALWQMLEPALLSPDNTAEALSSRGRRWHYAKGSAYTTVPDYAAWHAEHGNVLAPADRAHAYAGSLFELRQFAALLAAHRVPLRFDDSAAQCPWPVQQLAVVDPSLPPARLFAHEARGLGIVAVTAAQPIGSSAWRILAHAWPLDTTSLAALTTHFADQFGAEPQLQRLGTLVLDSAATQLDLPPLAQVH
ncbi:hypothetical protein [Tahibacter amnicola]|uniref:Uncharacterized protein n=1 Tax=Tahibacter amnicola TaxID=2976241 RepID=A0ABY6BG20_9GAMM|nr:hypothetical protein [Tahibacter amnicola]UXI68551.1 hypothetical protein N4264_02540 [Tahibacter amnicola]